MTELLWETERKTLDSWNDSCLQKGSRTGLRRFRLLSSLARYGEPLRVWKLDITVTNQRDESVSDLQNEKRMSQGWQ